MFPNTLRLQSYLVSRGIDSTEAGIHLERLDSFSNRIVSSSDTLCHKDQLDVEEAVDSLSRLLGEPVVGLDLLSRQNDLRGMKRQELYHVYRVAEHHSLDALLREREPFKTLWARRSDDAFLGRTLESMVSAAVGTDTLQQKFDASFGNNFSSLFKADIVTAWTLYLACLVENGSAHMAPLASAIEILARTRSVGRSGKKPLRWTFLVK